MHWGMLIISLGLSPLMLGLINRIKSFFGGRTGPSLFQPYRDISKLLRKGAVYSSATSWVFRAGPIVGLSSVLVAAMIIPMGGKNAPLAFSGDLFLFAYLLGLMRFFTVVAALDTGSSFEGMGASREVSISALAEPALLLGLAVVAVITGQTSLSAMYAEVSAETWLTTAAPLALVCVSLFAVFLTENARIPVDDPTTHLELTMIHEVMVLDHGGVDLAFVMFGSAVKLWVLGMLIVGLVVPIHAGPWWFIFLISIGGMAGVAVLTGIIESSMARLRLTHIPQLLIGAGALSLIALLLVLP